MLAAVLPRPAADPLRRLRIAMLAQLEGCDGLDAALLRLRLHCAADPHAMWHLRMPLMQTLAAERGESRARSGLSQVDGLFVHFWPDAPVSRPAPLR